MRRTEMRQEIRKMRFEEMYVGWHSRTRVVGAFPDGQSALMLVAARLRHVSATRWGTRQYLNMERLTENIVELA